MAKGFCIPQEIAEQLKEAVRKGEWSIDGLWNMTSRQRHELFSQYVDDATALRMNAGFEEAMISKQQNALVKWASQAFVGQDAKTVAKKKDLIDKIQELNEIGYIKVTTGKNGKAQLDEQSEIFLSDLVEEKLGVSISEQEMKAITEKTQKLESLSGTLSENNLPTKEYFAARRDLENYIKSLVPSSQLKIASSTIGRGAMLASIKSPLLNIESNTLYAGLQKLEKRMTRTLTGRNITVPKALSDYFKGWRKETVEIMNKYQYDTTRIMDLKSEMKRLGEEQQVHSQGKGVIRKVGRLYEDIIFNKLLSVPDVFYSAYAFGDSASLWSMEMAKKEGLTGDTATQRALEIAKDASRIEPTTLEGTRVRELAIADAQHATFTDDTLYSKVGLGLRSVLNVASGDLRLGDQLMPFVKTPANVIGAAIDMSGVGLIQGVITLPQAIQEAKSGNVAALDRSVRKMVASGLGLTFAYLLVAGLDPDDFIGMYPTNSKERTLMYEKGATPNSIKIGNKYVSLNYFGPLGPAMLGMLYAKKYKGQDILGLSFEYMRGLKGTLSEFPGVSEVAQIAEALTEDKSMTPEDFRQIAIQQTLDFAKARTIPSIVNDFAQVTDTFQRDTYKEGDLLAKIKSSIPGLRETLPIREDIFGEELKNESDLSILLFGSRVKTAKEGELITEITRLEGEGHVPSLTNSEYTSPRVKNMKAWLSSEDYEEMIDYYQDLWVKESLKTINSYKYKKLSSEEQADQLTEIKGDALDKALNKYNYNYLKRKNT